MSIIHSTTEQRSALVDKIHREGKGIAYLYTVDKVTMAQDIDAVDITQPLVCPCNNGPLAMCPAYCLLKFIEGCNNDEMQLYDDTFFENDLFIDLRRKEEQSGTFKIEPGIDRCACGSNEVIMGDKVGRGDEDIKRTTIRCAGCERGKAR